MPYDETKPKEARLTLTESEARTLASCLDRAAMDADGMHAVGMNDSTPEKDIRSIMRKLREPKAMSQRTCNIIQCCKGNSKVPVPEKDGTEWTSGRHRAVAAYMSRECACPMEDYSGGLLLSILQEAMFDYLDAADKPSADLRNLFPPVPHGGDSLADRIMSMFAMVRVYRDGRPVNGFTVQLLAQSAKDLAKDGGPAYAMQGGQMVPFPCRDGRKEAGHGRKAKKQR